MITTDDVKKIYNEYLKTLSSMTTELPSELQAFRGLVASVHKEGALSIKTKELIALGIAIITKCEACMVYHIKAGIQAGAKRGEILETAATAILMGGGPATGHLDLVLAALDAFGAVKE